MIKAKVTIKDDRKTWDALSKRVHEMSVKGGNAVDVGLFAEQGSDLVLYASANEFGAKINHPGGTPYGYKTRQDAEAGRVSFLGEGEGFMLLGVTGPHTIVIPERSFIRSTFDEEKAGLYKQIAKAKLDVILGKVDKDRFLDRLGLFLQRKIVEKINRSKEWAEPNAPSTIAQKTTSSGKGDQPLVDSGRMRQSTTRKLVK